jgi:hypothetical protein
MRSSDYSTKTADDHLATLDPDILTSLSDKQLGAFRQVLEAVLPRQSPKLVDLRFEVDLLINRFYVVLLIGKDRRKKPRRYIPSKVARVGNLITITLFLVMMNFTISGFLLLAGYLFKSAIGIDILPGHFPDLVKQWLGMPT